MVDDRLSELWAIQAEQQKAFGLDPYGMVDVEKAKVAKDLSLGLLEEVAELNRYTARYKAHYLQSPAIERQDVAHHAADVLKYLVAICQLHEVTAGELHAAFVRKSDVVEDRARGERLELQEHTPVVLTDLDDVIADLTNWRQKLVEIGGAAGEPLAASQEIEAWKDEFHRRGGLRTLAPIAGAVPALRAIRDMGYKIVIITARPYCQYKRLYADTIDWLRNHGVPYDLLLFNKDKAEAVHDHVLPARPAFLVEDREKHAKEVAGVGVPVLLFDREHNRDVPNTTLIRRVAGWDAVLEVAKRAKEARFSPANAR